MYISSNLARVNNAQPQKKATMHNGKIRIFPIRDLFLWLCMGFNYQKVLLRFATQL